MSSEERKSAIYIAENQIDNSSRWTVGVRIPLAFVRMIIDVVSWWEIVLLGLGDNGWQREVLRLSNYWCRSQWESRERQGLSCSGTTEITDLGNESFGIIHSTGKQRTLHRE